MKAEIREEFLNKYTNKTTRAFAAALYDLEEASKASHSNRVRERVLDVVDFDAEVDEKELETLGIELSK